MDVTMFNFSLKSSRPVMFLIFLSYSPHLCPHPVLYSFYLLFLPSSVVREFKIRGKEKRCIVWCIFFAFRIKWIVIIIYLLFTSSYYYSFLPALSLFVFCTTHTTHSSLNIRKKDILVWTQSVRKIDQLRPSPSLSLSSFYSLKLIFLATFFSKSMYHSILHHSCKCTHVKKVKSKMEERRNIVSKRKNNSTCPYPTFLSLPFLSFHFFLNSFLSLHIS